MKKKQLLVFLAVLMWSLMSMATLAMAEGVDAAQANADRLGLWTLVPPLVAIVLAFVTKNVVISLFIGVFTGCFILQINGFDVLTIFSTLFFAFFDLINKVLGSLSDPWNAGIILQCLTIGGVIALVAKMGGAKAIAEALAKRAKSPVSAQIITWVLGLIVFFDDYANALIVGPVMRPVTDKLRISREKLSFIVDATAAPIAGIAIISTWIGYELSLIRQAFQDGLGQEVDAFGFFISTIPYRFYNILILIFIVFTAVFLKEFGPMYKAEKRARETGKVIADGSMPMVTAEATALEPKNGIKLSMWNAIIPIGVLVFGALGGFYYDGYRAIMGGDDEALRMVLTNSPFSFDSIREAFSNSDASIVLFQAALLASIVAIIIGVAKKIFTVGEAVETWIQGMKSLVITGVILLLAWSLSSVVKELGTAKFLVTALSDSLPQFILPAIIFVLGALISFATGTSYGTMGILMPLAIPLAYGINPDMGYVVMSGSAVLTGAIFGDHSSPISDTTILSSMGSACDHIDHTKTQLWYAIFVGLVTIFLGYIPVGLGAPIYIVLPIDIAFVGAFIFFFGKSVKNINPKRAV